MKHSLIRIIFGLGLFLSFVLPAQAAETYTFDPTHTYVLWHVNHFGFSNPSGKWMVKGTLVFDEANPANSKINITIPLSDLTTGIPKLDEHLKSKDFFNIEKFPTATFVSNKIEMISENKAKLYGTLTVHGISKPVSLDITLNKIGISPITNKKTLGFTATTHLNRSDFGIDKYLPGLSNQVDIEIEAEASKST